MKGQADDAPASQPVGLWGWVATVIGVAAVLTVIAVSMSMNWRFGYSLGRSEIDGYIYGSASIAADALKAIVPFFIVAAWVSSQYMKLLASTVLWAVVMAFALTSAFGHGILNRVDSANNRVVSSDVYKDLRSARFNAQEQLKWVPQHRPAGTVQAEIESLKVQRAWQATDGCKTISGSGQRKFCQSYQALNAEVASASTAGQLVATIAGIDSKLGARFQTGAPEQGDVQAGLLSKWTHVDMDTAQLALVLLLVAMLELVSSCGLYVVTAYHGWGPAVAAKRRNLFPAREAIRQALAKLPMNVAIPAATVNDNTEEIGPEPVPMRPTAEVLPMSAPRSMSPAERAALADLKGLIARGDVILQEGLNALAKRWNVDPTLVTRWARLWEAEGHCGTVRRPGLPILIVGPDGGVGAGVGITHAAA